MEKKLAQPPSEDERFLWQERAAICEYEAGLSRADAEALATRELAARQQAAASQHPAACSLGSK